MKKYITTLAVMAFAIAGCTQQPELTGDTEGKNAPPPPTEEEVNKSDGGDADSSDPSKGGEKTKGDEKK